MTLATMADRSLPLAERVRMAVDDYPCWPDEDQPEALALLDALLADVAAADRLARAAAAMVERPSDDMGQVILTRREYIAALSAYRARMAQEVDRGE